MIHRKYLLVALALCCALILFACAESEDTYTIRVRNELDEELTIKIDGEFMGVVPAGGELIIKNIEEGNHLLEAESEGYEPIERWEKIDRNFVWTIY